MPYTGSPHEAAVYNLRPVFDVSVIPGLWPQSNDNEKNYEKEQLTKVKKYCKDMNERVS